MEVAGGDSLMEEKNGGKGKECACVEGNSQEMILLVDLMVNRNAHVVSLSSDDGLGNHSNVVEMIRNILGLLWFCRLQVVGQGLEGKDFLRVSKERGEVSFGNVGFGLRDLSCIEPVANLSHGLGEDATNLKANGFILRGGGLEGSKLVGLSSNCSRGNGLGDLSSSRVGFGGVHDFGSKVSGANSSMFLNDPKEIATSPKQSSDNKPILLQKWHPDMELNKVSPRFIPPCMKFYDIPLEMGSLPSLTYIASTMARKLTEVVRVRMPTEDIDERCPQQLRSMEQDKLVKLGNISEGLNEGFERVSKKDGGLSSTTSPFEIVGLEMDLECCYGVKRVVVIGRELSDNLWKHKLRVGNSPWLVLGDFNVTLFSSETLWGNNNVSNDMINFRLDQILGNGSFSISFPDQVMFSSSWILVITAYWKEFSIIVKKSGRKRKVKILRKEVELIQGASDRDPFNKELWDQEVVFPRAFRLTLLDEERFLKQKSTTL
ncbi:hypothetical protein Pint_20804 [Pistacia integerrima]|uniref:Uncharacterized protein n=1 Tax=Pistacia integerrima TaxID=434235 RepID=A0ACC0XBQ1_9ROSI|nr:hypothetical protein Pint_20804 [Pistacia integerrima]